MAQGCTPHSFHGLLANILMPISILRLYTQLYSWCPKQCVVQVSQAVDMAQVTPLLMELGAYDGLVALAVAKAKALDPEQVATQQSDAGADARMVCCCAPLCLLHITIPDTDYASITDNEEVHRVPDAEVQAVVKASPGDVQLS